MGNIKNLSSISNKLSQSFMGGKDTEMDRHLSALARQKQLTDLPMAPEVRLAAYEKRETIRPEAKMTCPNGHKVAVAAARKALATKDVYQCGEDGCGALCGGADVHPLHLEIRHLHLADKNKYVDSCRWLSKSETDVQTREYIRGQTDMAACPNCGVRGLLADAAAVAAAAAHSRPSLICSNSLPLGHPLVYPHLATGVLFNDETDAWHGYTLAWNIYFWFNDIATYWTKVRREMEQRAGAGLDEDGDDAAEDGEERGRGKRKRRKLTVENQQRDADAEADAEQEEEEDAQLAAATAASIAEHKQQVKPSASSSAAGAAAAAAATPSAAAASGGADAEERKTAETIEID